MTHIQADFGRQTVVVAALALVGVAGVSYLGYSWWQSSRSTPSNVAAVPGNGQGVAAEESARYRQILDEYNQRNAAIAKAGNGTYVSVPSTRGVSTPPGMAEDAPPAAPAPASAPAAAASAPPPAATVSVQQQLAVDPDRVGQLEEQVKALMDNWSAEKHGLAIVAQDGKAYTASLQPPQPAAPPSSQQLADAPGEQLVPGYELVAAELRTGIDTDEDSLVEAAIPAGPYAGAHVFAPGYKRLENTVDMTFTGMTWRGRTYKINAKAVDKDSLRTALSGEVNNRYFSRIVLPALATGLGRVGQLFERSGSTTVISPLGGAVITAPESVSGRQVAGAVVGGAAQQAGNVLAHDAAAMPVKQVLVPPNTTIGVRFLAPVFASDEVRGNTTPTPAVASGNTRSPLPPPAAAQGWPPAVPPVVPGVPLQPPPGFTPPYVPSPYAPNQ
ncbi:conjugal transfer protein TraO [Azohydromonas australica]|uniref:conjugal transfer protein TraO n=1 Tax=Azohydromonas australica TaxID=364039 RepID=UPI000414AE1D|nr:conjugal transfer protein TraO [Azohydromonas australica]